MPKRLGVTRSPDPNVVRVRTETNGLAALKTCVVLLLIALQLGLLIFLFLRFLEAFGAYLVISLALSVATAAFVLSSDQSPSTKAVWVFVVLVFFVAGFLLYFASDRRVFFGGSRRRYDAVFRRTAAYAPPGCDTAGADARVREDCTYLRRTGGFPAFRGTDAVYFPSGGRLFDDILARLRAAQKFVFIEYFCISDGVLLERMLAVLAERAAAGVDVRIIYDDMGSHSTFRGRTKRRIRRAGIRLMPFNRLMPVLNIGMNFRDHRKIVVVDGETAYTGGANLADEYINELRMYGYWKDAGVRLDGAAVDGFTHMFLRQWEFLSRAAEDYAPYLGLAAPRENASLFVPYAGGLDFDAPICRDVFRNIIAKAQGRLWLMTPYLVPDDELLDLLGDKAEGGTDVRVILPGVPDKGIVYRLTLANGEKLASRGVRVCCMKDSFVHSKLMLSDVCCVVGSVNMDMRSFYERFECAVYSDDVSLYRALEEDFARTFAECAPLSLRRGAVGRVADRLLQIAAPLM